MKILNANKLKNNRLTPKSVVLIRIEPKNSRKMIAIIFFLAGTVTMLIFGRQFDNGRDMWTWAWLVLSINCYFTALCYVIRQEVKKLKK